MRTILSKLLYASILFLVGLGTSGCMLNNMFGGHHKNHGNFHWKSQFHYEKADKKDSQE